MPRRKGITSSNVSSSEQMVGNGKQLEWERRLSDLGLPTFVGQSTHINTAQTVSEDLGPLAS